MRAAGPRPARVRVSLAERLRSGLLTALLALVPKRSDKIVVHSQPDLRDGALAVLAALLERGHEPWLLCEDIGAACARAEALGVAIKPLAKDSLRGRLHYLSAGTVITTHGAYSSHRPPRTQTVVNLWHGEPLTKPVGLWDGQPPTRSTWAVTLSEVGRAFRCAEFGLEPAQVLVTGAPGNDRLVAADRDGVRRALGCGDETLFLWLPTYRQATSTGRIDGRPSSGMLPISDAATDALDRWLASSGARLLVKPHPLSPRPPHGAYGQIAVIDEDWLAARGVTLYEALAAADCLITDASSVWIDHLLADRPLICAFPDLDEYVSSRGLHLDPYDAWITGPLVRDEAALTEAMAHVVAGDDPFREARRRMRLRLHKHADARSSERLLDALEL